MSLLPPPRSRPIEPYRESAPHSVTILGSIGDQAGHGKRRTPVAPIITPAALPIPLTLSCHASDCPKYDGGGPARHPELSAGSRKHRKSPRVDGSILSRWVEKAAPQPWHYAGQPSVSRRNLTVKPG